MLLDITKLNDKKADIDLPFEIYIKNITNCVPNTIFNEQLVITGDNNNNNNIKNLSVVEHKIENNNFPLKINNSQNIQCKFCQRKSFAKLTLNKNYQLNDCTCSGEKRENSSIAASSTTLISPTNITNNTTHNIHQKELVVREKKILNLSLNKKIKSKQSLDPVLDECIENNINNNNHNNIKRKYLQENSENNINNNTNNSSSGNSATRTEINPKKLKINNNNMTSRFDYVHSETSTRFLTAKAQSLTIDDDLQSSALSTSVSDREHFKNYLSSSLATLCNIGNTCYLNSVVYTLRFAPLFLHNLHHLVDDLLQINQKLSQNKTKSSSLGRNISSLQGYNARSWSSKDLASLGNNNLSGGGGTMISDIPVKTPRQIATEKLHDLYRSLRDSEQSDSIEPFHADKFLNAIQDVNSIFEGNQQQDAHEFLMCILDSIRETCQTLTKLIGDCPDIVMNGYVNMPEQITVQPQQSTSSSPVQIKNFFSRKSKRKDKKPKLLSINIKHMDNNVNTGSIINAQTTTTTTTTTIEEEYSDQKEKISEKIKKIGLDFFTEDFEGVTVSTTKCLTCETITEQKETMIDLSVPITGVEIIDSDNPHLFIQKLCITREQFRGDNKYRCEQCFGYTEAIRSISYPVLPRLLVIQLKRFSGGMEKINSYIPTPFTLQCFCSKCCLLPENEKLHVYKLYSVITHVGATLSVGHYIAYTCSLDFNRDYVNCPKDNRKHLTNLYNLNNMTSTSLLSTSTNQSSSLTGLTTTGTTSITTTSSIAPIIINNNSGHSEKSTGLMKKMIFGRNKASSSGDVTKIFKNINGITTNGIAKITCKSLNCCGVQMKSQSFAMNGNATNYDDNMNVNNHINGIGIQHSSTPLTSASSSTASSSTATATTTTTTTTAATTINVNATSLIQSGGYNRNLQPDPIWYMCDDDKIKAMSQKEFEELLSPNKKIMITPYLLFYARTDLLTTNNDLSK